MFPFLTFHGTRNQTTLESILKYGYITPGDEHVTYGHSLSMRCGNVYGEGIYSSPNYSAAQRYTFLDKNQSITLIANFLIPGVTKIVDSNKWYRDEN